MADNVESRVGKIPQSVMSQFQSDCDSVVRLKAVTALDALREKYSRWGLVSNEVEANLLKEMGYGSEDIHGRKRFERDYQSLLALKGKDYRLVTMLFNAFEARHAGSKFYDAVKRDELMNELGLTGGRK